MSNDTERRVVITGASDDLIEIDGDITEEFGADSGLLAFSEGTVLRIGYTNEGVWRIGLVIPGAATLTITQAPEDDDRYCTDEAVLVGDVRWVVHGNAVAR